MSLFQKKKEQRFKKLGFRLAKRILREFSYKERIKKTRDKKFRAQSFESFTRNQKRNIRKRLLLQQ